MSKVETLMRSKTTPKGNGRLECWNELCVWRKLDRPNDKCSMVEYAVHVVTVGSDGKEDRHSGFYSTDILMAVKEFERRANED